MDNQDKQNTSEPGDEFADSPLIITLTSSQYFYYHTHRLAIQGPDGRHLAFIGKAMQADIVEQDVFRLREQVALAHCLLSNINDSFTLSIPAAMGLVNLLKQVEEMCCRWVR